jgi:hypothetical protein
MPKFPLLIAATGFVFLVACEPLEVPGPREYRRPRPSRYDDYRQERDTDRYRFSEDEETAPPPEPTEQIRPNEESDSSEPDEPSESPPKPRRNPKDYPVAERTTNPSQVRSPYEPYNVIDVEGFTSGQLARDPSNQKIFRVP